MARYKREPTASRYGTFSMSSFSFSVFGDISVLRCVCGSAGIGFGLQFSILNFFSSARVSSGCAAVSSFFSLFRPISTPRNRSASMVRILNCSSRCSMIRLRLSILLLQIRPSSTKIERIVNSSP